MFLYVSPFISATRLPSLSLSLLNIKQKIYEHKICLPCFPFHFFLLFTFFSPLYVSVLFLRALPNSEEISLHSNIFFSPSEYKTFGIYGEKTWLLSFSFCSFLLASFYLYHNVCLCVFVIVSATTISTLLPIPPSLSQLCFYIYKINRIWNRKAWLSRLSIFLSHGSRKITKISPQTQIKELPQVQLILTGLGEGEDDIE